MQTREDRIFRHRKSLLDKRDRIYGDYTDTVWMTLARHWKIPIREIKRIVAEEKERRHGNVAGTN